MQGITRNPLADPGILGVNAGAALVVVIAITSSGSPRSSATSGSPSPVPRSRPVVVYSIASLGREGATPVKLALAGAALSAALARRDHRLPAAGPGRPSTSSGSGRSAPSPAATCPSPRQVAPFLIVGTVLRALPRPAAEHALARRRRGPRRSGANVALGRVLSPRSPWSSCAARRRRPAGPIAFVGLAIPHVARALVGPDYRWVLPYSLLLAPILLLSPTSSAG